MFAGAQSKPMLKNVGASKTSFGLAGWKENKAAISDCKLVLQLKHVEASF